MNENSLFNIDRVRFLLIRQLRFNTQSLLIGFAAVAGLLTFILTMRVIFGNTPLDSTTFFGNIMPYFFAGGFVFTRSIFSELKTSHRGYLYLTLPASALEKLAVAWFISAVLYMVAALVVMFIINLLLMAFALIFMSPHVPFFNLFDPSILKAYAVYLVTQSVFFLGSIYFRRVHFLKTMLSLFVIGVIIAIYTSVAARLIIFHNFSSFQFGADLPDNIKNFFENTFAPIIRVLFWYCLAPFFLVVSYFCLKERQV